MADAAAATPTGFSTEGFFEFVSAMVKDRRALIRRPITVAFAIVGEGHFLITSANKEPLTREWKDDADLGMWCAPSFVNLKRGPETLGQFTYDEILVRLRAELDKLIEERKTA